MKTFGELLELHREIDEMFFAHQCALLRFEFSDALSGLERYESALFEHMEYEEHLLLPLYEKRCPVTKSGTAKIFFDDHQKMRGFVKLFKEETAKLLTNPAPESVLLMLLDREAFYKRLCSHHNRRESETLYPALDEYISEAEKRDLLARVTRKVDLEQSSMTN